MASQPIAASAAQAERHRSDVEMKRLTFILLAALAPALAQSEAQTLTLEIKVDHGVVTGFVRNNSDKAIKVNAEHYYGWWEITKLFYFDGSWHQARLTEEKLVRMGKARDPVEVTLQPGGVLGAPPRPHVIIAYASPQTNCTFGLELSNYELPKDLATISKIRVETQGLKCAIDVENPNKALRSDAVDRARER